MKKQLFSEFILIANKLNAQFDIAPLLYGSLGLEHLTNINFEPKDIDILIPKEYLSEKWNEFKEAIEKQDYLLQDLSEHEFCKNEFRVAFASIEELEDFVGIKAEEISGRTYEDTDYKLLNVNQYYTIYSRSVKDGYRITSVA